MWVRQPFLGPPSVFVTRKQIARSSWGQKEREKSAGSKRLQKWAADTSQHILLPPYPWSHFSLVSGEKNTSRQTQTIPESVQTCWKGPEATSIFPCCGIYQTCPCNQWGGHRGHGGKDGPECHRPKRSSYETDTGNRKKNDFGRPIKPQTEKTQTQECHLDHLSYVYLTACGMFYSMLGVPYSPASHISKMLYPTHLPSLCELTFLQLVDLILTPYFLPHSCN